MNKQKKKWKIGKDLTEYLSFANIWYLGILVVIFILMFIFLGRFDAPIQNFLSFSHGASKIYMIVMGAIGAYYFVPMYVQLGVTRKQSVIGNGIGAVGGTLTLVLFTIIIGVVQHLIFQGLNIAIADEQSLFLTFMNFTGGSGNNHFLLEQTFLANLSRWLITFSSFWLSVLLGYMIGWLIGTGFYRNIIYGIGTILMGIVFTTISDFLWGGSALPFVPDVTFQGNPLNLWIIGFVITILLIGIGFWVIRQLTKRIKIKY
jgi:hypothetical protein